MLLEKYRKEVLPKLKLKLGLGDDLAVPRLEKIVVNAGIGKLLAQQPKNLEQFKEGLSKLTGQKPFLCKAKKAISGFKIRTGQVVGLMVTLRGKRMYDFLQKLMHVVLARSRDFRGLSRNGFDGRGNYSLGIKEHLVFPEMAQEDLGISFGLEISIVTTAKTDEQAYALLSAMGCPFKD